MRTQGGTSTSDAWVPGPVADDSSSRGGQWFSTQRRVAWSETDPSEAYTFPSALRYAEDAEVAWLRSRDLLSVLYPHLPRIYAGVRFLQPLHFDEELSTRLALVRLGRTSLHYLFRLERESTLCAVGKLGVVYVSGTSGPTQLPPDVVKILAADVLAPTDELRCEVEHYLT